MTAYMLGLAAGSRWAGGARLATKRPVATYAILEAGIALYALLFPLLVSGVESLYSRLFGAFAGSFLVLSGLRFVLSLAILLPATFCMGATLPALVRVVVREPEQLAIRTGLLYGVNTLGGVLGTLVAGFFALEHLGIRGTIWLGVSLNLAIAGVAFVWSRRARETGETPGPAASPPRRSVEGHSAERLSAAWRCFLIVGCAGLVSMALEVVWSRALLFYVHNSTYAFSAILAVYLLGLGAGATVGAKAAGGRRAGRWMVLTLAAMAGSVLLSIAVYRHLPVIANLFFGDKLAPGLSGYAGQSPWVVRGWLGALGSIFAQVAAVLFPPAFVFGMVFPLAVRLAAGRCAEPGRLAGNLYSVNTVGSVVGTVLGSFVLVPLLGTPGALLLLAWLPVPLALLWMYRELTSTQARWAAMGASLAVFGGLTIVVAPLDFYQKMFGDRFGKVLWFSEGISETVAICEHEDRSAWIHYSDGRGASGTTSYRGGWLYAHLPLLLHPDPRSALVICFGTGNTLGAASLHPLERLDGVELSTEVLKASSFFKETNHDVARNSRVRMIIEDGRNYLLGTRTRYDVITEEPPLLHTAGVVNLYSRDFYQLCSRRLTDNGIMAVWLATWDLEERDLQMLVRAFVEAFPHVSAWDSSHLGEWILIGSKQPLALDADRLRERIAQTALAADLGKIGIRTPADLLALYLKGGGYLASFSSRVPPVTDDRSVVDYTTPRQARANYGLGDYMVSGYSVAGVGPHGLVSEVRVRDFDAVYTQRDRVESLLTKPLLDSGDPLFAEIEQHRQQAELLAGRKIARNVIASALDFLRLQEPTKSLEALDRGLRLVGAGPSADLMIAKASVCRRLGRLQEAHDLLARVLALDPGNTNALYLLSQWRSVP